MKQQRGSILLVDDDRHVLASMADWLRRDTRLIRRSTGGRRPRHSIARGTTYCWPIFAWGADDGFDVLDCCRKKHPATSVIMITGYGCVESAVEAIRAGAFDFLTKPLIDEELDLAIQRALDQQRVLAENKNLKDQLDLRFGLQNIVGHDHRMLKIYDMIDSIADTRATLLVTGESGTGKSMIARAVHRRSGRRDKPFVEVACGACPKPYWKANCSATWPAPSPGQATSWASSCRPRGGPFSSTKSARPARPCRSSCCGPAGLRVRAGGRKQDLPR